MDAPAFGDDWVGLTEDVLPSGAATSWATVPGCGAVVTFTGTVRDSADGRAGVTELVYEAYAEPAERRMREVCAEARTTWPMLGRVALLHRLGRLGLCDAAVAVVVSAPHRPEAFAAAAWCIDTLKAAVPIWKKETWDGGSDWGTRAQSLDSVSRDS